MRRIAPMKAAAGPLPTSDRWAYEIKWDGMRAVTHVAADGVRAHSAKLNAITASFPELENLAGALGMDAVLDGELVALRDGQPSFLALQQRIHLTKPADVARKAAEVPVVYVIFDVLAIGDTETLTLPFDARRELLEKLVEPGPTWRLTDVHRGDGTELLAVVTDLELEGIVAKRVDSPYDEGRRSDNWVKVKPRRRQEFVVVGWLSSEKGRDDRLAALLLGYYDDGALRFAGSVGSGLGQAEITRLQTQFDAIGRDDNPTVDDVPRFPRRTCQFVEPNVVVEIAFAQWTDDGNLRHPAYLGQRTDVDPTSTRREA